MLNISMIQALTVWTMLEEARHGTSSYGGDTCEIYMYMVMPYTPSATDSPSFGGYIEEARRKAYANANETLYEILDLFAKTHEVQVEVDGRTLGPWLKSDQNQHRVHVRIPRQLSEQEKNEPTLLVTLDEPFYYIGNLAQLLSDRCDERGFESLTPVAFRSRADGKVDVLAYPDEDEESHEQDS